MHVCVTVCVFVFVCVCVCICVGAWAFDVLAWETRSGGTVRPVPRVSLHDWVDLLKTAAYNRHTLDLSNQRCSCLRCGSGLNGTCTCWEYVCAKLQHVHPGSLRSTPPEAKLPAFASAGYIVDLWPLWTWTHYSNIFATSRPVLFSQRSPFQLLIWLSLNPLALWRHTNANGPERERGSGFRKQRDEWSH